MKKGFNEKSFAEVKKEFDAFVDKQLTEYRTTAEAVVKKAEQRKLAQLQKDLTA